MPLIASDQGRPDIAPIAATMHHAICYGVVDIGTQPAFGNFPARRKVLFLWEVPGERIDIVKDGVSKNLARAISEKYTLSLASKGNLRPMLESWRGRAFTAAELEGFDVMNVAGANCLLNIVHVNGKGEKANRVYANVSSVNPLMKGMPKQTAENPLIRFSMADFTGPVVIPPGIPEWIEALIKQSTEYQDRMSNAAHPPANNGEASGGADEDVPF